MCKIITETEARAIRHTIELLYYYVVHQCLKHTNQCLTYVVNSYQNLTIFCLFVLEVKPKFKNIGAKMNGWLTCLDPLQVQQYCQ